MLKLRTLFTAGAMFLPVMGMVPSPVAQDKLMGAHLSDYFKITTVDGIQCRLLKGNWGEALDYPYKAKPKIVVDSQGKRKTIEVCVEIITPANS